MPSDRAIQSAASNAPVLESQLDHNTLLNLAVGDVHTHYILVDGTRAFTGTVTIGSGGDLVVDTDTLFVDAALDRVGINTPTPGSTLDMRNSTGPQIRTNNWADLSSNGAGKGVFAGNFYTDNVGSLYRYSRTHAFFGAMGIITHFPIANKLSIVSSDTTASTTDAAFTPLALLTVLFDGNVGINQVSPTETLHVVGTGLFTSDLTVSGNLLATHGALTDVLVDDHTQYALLAGRAGGQSLIGGTASGDDIDLTGSSDGGNIGQIHLNSPTRFKYSPATTIGDEVANQTFMLRFAETYTASAVFHFERVISIVPTVTVTSGQFNYQIVSATGSYHNTVAPGVFTAFLLFNAQNTFTTSVFTVPVLPTIFYNAQPTFKIDGQGSGSTGDSICVYYIPTIRAVQAGDTNTAGTCTALKVAPVWQTNNATATANLGTFIGVDCLAPTVAPFGQSLGTETIANYYGLRMRTPTLIPTGEGIALYCQLTNNSAFRMLKNDRGASSEINGNMRFINGVIGTNGMITFESTATTAHIQFDTAGPNLRFESITGPHIQVIDGGDELEIIWTGTTQAISPGASGGGGSNSWDIEFHAAGSPAGASEHHEMGGSGASHWDYQHMTFGGAFPRVSGTTRRGAFIFSPGGAPFMGSTDDVWSSIEIQTGTNVNINGRTNTEVNALLLKPVGITLSGGSIADESQFHIDGMGTDGTRQQGLWCDGARARVDGILTMGFASPTQLVANTDNYVIPVDGSGRSVLRLSTDASRNLTGMVVEQEGDTIWIVNVGSFDLVLVHDATSTATNRFLSPTGVDLILGPDESALCWHDDTTDRWRILFTTGA